jgi:hypothetical protein
MAIISTARSRDSHCPSGIYAAGIFKGEKVMFETIHHNAIDNPVEMTSNPYLLHNSLALHKAKLSVTPQLELWLPYLHIPDRRKLVEPSAWILILMHKYLLTRNGTSWQVSRSFKNMA